jgi:hypothetical protein
MMEGALPEQPDKQHVVPILMPGGPLPSRAVKNWPT